MEKKLKKMARMATLFLCHDRGLHPWADMLIAFGAQGRGSKRVQQPPHTHDRLYRGTKREVCQGLPA